MDNTILKTNKANTIGTNGTVNQLRTIFILFLFFRLSILFLFSPNGLFNVYTDYHYYYRIARLTDKGFYPFINMWFEYPPVTTYTDIGAYRLLRLIIPQGDLSGIGFIVYTRILGSLLLVFETGTLVLLHKTSEKLWGINTANWTAWIYAMLSIPLFYWNASHNSILIFFMLCAIYLEISKHWIASAIALGISIASKFTPVFLIPAVVWLYWKKETKKALAYSALTILTTIIIYVPFYILGGSEWILASFKSLGNVASWSTVWAILDGNWGPGNVGPIGTRIIKTMAGVSYGNPAKIPETLKLAVFGLGYAVLFFFPITPKGNRKFIRFATLTAMIFVLWSKGWSPQWGMLVIPMILLSFPNKWGLTMVLLLSSVIILEWPLSGIFHSHFILATAIILRTAIILVIALRACKKLSLPPCNKLPKKRNPEPLNQ